MAADMEASTFIMFNMHACVHVCACTCMCVHGTLPTHPYPLPPHPPICHPQGDPQNQSKLNNT